MIQPTDIAARHEGALFRTIDQETVLYHADTGASMLLDPIGSLIWACFAEAVSVQELAVELAEEFETPREVIEPQVLDLVNALEAEGFLVVSTGNDGS